MTSRGGASVHPRRVRPHNSSAPTTAPTQPVRSRSAVPAWAIGVAAVVAIALGVLVVWNQHWLGGGTKPVAVSTVTATVTADVPTPTDGSSDPATDEPTGEATDEPTTEATTPTVTATKSPSELRREAFVTLEQLVADDAELVPHPGAVGRSTVEQDEGIVDKSRAGHPIHAPRDPRRDHFLEEAARLWLTRAGRPPGRLGGSRLPARTRCGCAFADIDVASKAEVVAWCQKPTSPSAGAPSSTSATRGKCTRSEVR